MTRIALAALTLLAGLNQPALAQDRAPLRGLNANPSALIADEIALSQLALEKGEGKAMRDTSVAGAMVIETAPQTIEAWLKSHTALSEPVKWDAQSVWMSCDGAIGVVEGVWTLLSESGRFTSVWQRQEKGGYKWLLRQRQQASAKSLNLPDFLSATVADCPVLRKAESPPALVKPNKAKPSKGKSKKNLPLPVNPLSGSSPDKSLTWQWAPDATGVERLLVSIAKGGITATVLGT